MAISFKSWKSLNEALSKGKEVFINPSTNKKQKVVWKVQDESNFMIKIIRDLDVIDERGQLTKNGVFSIINFLNSQSSFIQTIGKLDQYFFNEKFIAYTVLTDNNDIQKIQFKILDRKKYPNIPNNISFISTDGLKTMNVQNSLNIINDIESKVKSEDINENPEKIESVKISDIKGTESTKKERGNKFLYTMRTNGKLYLMEFGPNGEIIAEVQNEKDPNGIISYENNKIIWITDLDETQNSNKWIKRSNLPLYQDTEITNEQDKQFFIKIFTDKSFRDSIIDEYEEKYGSSELNVKNLKKMLYFQDGTPIFQEEIEKDKDEDLESIIKSIISQK